MAGEGTAQASPASAWRRVALSDLADEITVGHVGPMASEYVVDGIPFLRSTDIEPFRIKMDEIKRISSRVHTQIEKSRLRPGDVVIVRTGKPGACAVVPSSLPEANCSDMVIVRPGPELDPDFLCYYVNSVAKDHVFSHLVGAVQQHFNVGSARTLTLSLPSLEMQRGIAGVLKALDDKITLNRKMNATLESMARALFKSWFIDFDLVRAKAEGRDPGLPQLLADLFPDSFEDSELGEIPRGWRVGCVDDEFDLTMGQSPPGNTYNEAGDGLPFYQGRKDFGFRFPIRRIYCTAPTRRAKQGDTLISVRAPVGDINMATEDCAIGRGVAAARHKTGSRSYSYQFMRSQAEVFGRFNAEGTVFGSIGKKDFHAISYVVPPRDLVVEFERRVALVDGRIESAEYETRMLTTLRDNLLPKLISGDLRVKDAEMIAERVAS